jgi:hypothetical protein
MQIADGSRDFDVLAESQLVFASGDERDHAARFVRTRFGVLVNE